jgi:hypothetical protein
MLTTRHPAGLQPARSSQRPTHRAPAARQATVGPAARVRRPLRLELRRHPRPRRHRPGRNHRSDDGHRARHERLHRLTDEPSTVNRSPSSPRAAASAALGRSRRPGSPPRLRRADRRNVAAGRPSLALAPALRDQHLHEVVVAQELHNLDPADVEGLELRADLARQRAVVVAAAISVVASPYSVSARRIAAAAAPRDPWPGIIAHPGVDTTSLRRNTSRCAER